LKYLPRLIKKKKKKKKKSMDRHAEPIHAPPPPSLTGCGLPTRRSGREKREPPPDLAFPCSRPCPLLAHAAAGGGEVMPLEESAAAAAPDLGAERPPLLLQGEGERLLLLRGEGEAPP
jgi:hypothetical protein